MGDSIPVNCEENNSKEVRWYLETRITTHRPEWQQLPLECELAKYKYRFMHPEESKSEILALPGYIPMKKNMWYGTSVCALLGGTINLQGRFTGWDYPEMKF